MHIEGADEQQLPIDYTLACPPPHDPARPTHPESFPSILSAAKRTIFLKETSK
jgi:hypothetical protein